MWSSYSLPVFSPSLCLSSSQRLCVPIVCVCFWLLSVSFWFVLQWRVFFSVCCLCSFGIPLNELFFRCCCFYFYMCCSICQKILSLFFCFNLSLESQFHSPSLSPSACQLHVTPSSTFSFGYHWCVCVSSLRLSLSVFFSDVSHHSSPLLCVWAHRLCLGRIASVLWEYILIPDWNVSLWVLLATADIMGSLGFSHSHMIFILCVLILLFALCSLTR